MTQSSKSKVVRGSNRAHYDNENLYQILDTGFICHLSYNYNGSPIIIPTGYVREDDIVYIHGSLKNRMMNSIIEQEEACVSVTHLDGLVLARSAFHHSFNYRSAVVFGKPFKVDDKDEKDRVLALLTENILPGRWEEVRTPSDKELKATMVIGIRIKEFSVKIRGGGPIDDKNDYELEIWAGELPIQQKYGQPVPDEQLKVELPVPNSVMNALKD